MCKPQSEGGQRCAYHTRKALTAAAVEYHAAPTEAKHEALQEALADHASTPTGKKELQAELALLWPGSAEALDRREALRRGEQIRERNAAVRDAVRAAKPGAQPSDHLNAETLEPGDRFSLRGANVVVLGEKEPWTDPFGRAMFRYWSRREDTGQEGYVPFGPGGVVSRADGPPHGVPSPAKQ